jgi:hypothetical protein
VAVVVVAIIQPARLEVVAVVEKVTDLQEARLPLLVKATPEELADLLESLEAVAVVEPGLLEIMV